MRQFQLTLTKKINTEDNELRTGQLYLYKLRYFVWSKCLNSYLDNSSGFLCFNYDSTHFVSFIGVVQPI